MTNHNLLLKQIEHTDSYSRGALKLALSELTALYGSNRSAEQAEKLGSIAQAIAIIDACEKERQA